MEKFNWKSRLKEDAKEFGERMFDFLCILIAVVIVYKSQTQIQLDAISIIVFGKDRDWVMIIIILLGIIMIANVIKKILQGVFWIIKMLVKLVLYIIK